MWSRIRTALMWLLVAALPVQSGAAVSMVHCGPSHHRMSSEAPLPHDAAHPSQTAVHHASEPHAGHTQGHPSAGETDAVKDAVNADATGNPPTDADPGSLQKLGKFKCSACASCCLGLALPGTFLSFDASVSADTLEPGRPQAAAVFLTGGLERPPRPRHA